MRHLPTAKSMPPLRRRDFPDGTTTILKVLAWLLRNVEIDGLYLDGIGYDRRDHETRAQGARPTIARARLIDFHSGNEFRLS